jgi:hypothetical protein
MILALQIDDDWYKEVKDSIGQDTMMVPNFEGYSLDNDILLRYNGRIYVPPNDGLRNLILRKAHRAVYMAHPGSHENEGKPKDLYSSRKE